VYIDDVVFSEVEVFSYDGTQYNYVDGTSFAAPMVAGVAALLWGQHPSLSHYEVRAAILAGSDPLPGLAGKVASGGRLNAAGAIQFIPEPSRLLLQISGLAGLVVLSELRRRILC